jgi:hypothetical protein
VGVVLCYFPGRLARKFVYQALPIDGLYSGRHLGRGHQGPLGGSSQDQLMTPAAVTLDTPNWTICTRMYPTDSCSSCARNRQRTLPLRGIPARSPSVAIDDQPVAELRQRFLPRLMFRLRPGLYRSGRGEGWGSDSEPRYVGQLVQTSRASRLWCDGKACHEILERAGPGGVRRPS